MFLYVILFNCKMPIQFYSKSNFPKTDVWRLLGNTGIHHIHGAPDDLIVFIVFHQFGVIS